MAMERSLVLIKPDALQRALVGEILGRFERKGMKIVGMKMLVLHDALLDEHYRHLSDKPFFPRIRDFMTSTPVVAVCIEGLDAINVIRDMTGVTVSREADVGTIRGDLAMSVQSNLIHASDSTEAAFVEIERFFHVEELFDYQRVLDSVIYAPNESRI